MMMPPSAPEIEGMNFKEMLRHANRDYFVKMPTKGKAGVVSVEKAIGGKSWALFISSDDCPACEAFREVLKKTYEELKRQNKPWEVVELMYARDANYYQEARKSSPWPFVPLSDHPTRQKVAESVQLQSVPQLYLCDPEGNCIQSDGIPVIKRDGAYGYPFEPWRPTLLGSLVFGSVCVGIGFVVWKALLGPMFSRPEGQAKNDASRQSGKGGSGGGGGGAGRGPGM